MLNKAVREDVSIVAMDICSVVALVEAVRICADSVDDKSNFHLDLRNSKLFDVNYYML